MQYSANLHLNLPEDSDPLEVSKLSENFEALDGAISEAGAIAAQKVFKVGDTLTTWRTDLGENWLLCNGESFNKSQYPDLAAICPGLEVLAEEAKAYEVPSILMDGSHYSSSSASMAFSQIDSNKGVSVVPYSNGNFTTRGLVYTTDRFKTVQKMNNPPKVSTSSYEAPFAVYAVGDWFIVISALTTWWSIFATQDLNSDPTWQGGASALNFMGGSGSSAAFVWPALITSSKGKYYMFMERSNSSGNAEPAVVEADNPWFANPTVHKLVHSNLVTADAWHFVETQKFYAFVGTVNNKLTDILFAHKNTPLGPYAEKQIPQNGSTNAPNVAINNIYSSDNPYDCIFCTASDKTEAYVGYILLTGATVATDPNWLHTTGPVANAIPNSREIYIEYDPDNRYSYFISSAGHLFSCKWPLSPKSLQYLGQVIINGTTTPFTMGQGTYMGQHTVFESDSVFISPNSSRNKIQIINKLGVPTINTPGCYTYIKAKEDSENVDQQADTPAP